MSKYKRWFTYLLFIVGIILLLFVSPMNVLADDEGTSIPVTETIYWEITNQTLTISDEEVTGDLQNHFSSRNSIQNSNLSWYSEREHIKNVEVVAQISPVNLSYWFSGFTACTQMELELLDTSNATTMANMFENCSSLTTIDVSHFNTSNVKNMSSLFYGCTELESLDLTGFDSSNVTNLSSMLYRCTKLVSIDLSSFQTANVTNMRFLFYGCSALQELDLTFITANEQLKTNSMLRNLTSLKKIIVNDDIIPLLSTTNLQYNWYSEELEEYTEDHPIPAAGTYYKTCKVTFHGDDTNIVGTKYVIYNTTTNADGIDIPNQVGYLFSKWVTSRMGNTEFDFSVPITQDVDVYAGFIICNHDFGEWEVTRNPACDEAGSRHRICSKCSYEAIESIAKLSHTFESPLVSGYAPSCTEEGLLENQYCSICEKYYDAEENFLETVIIPPLGHTYAESIDWNWNTEKTRVEVTFTCTVCSHQEIVLASLTENVIPATCLAAGSKTITATITFEEQTYTDVWSEVYPITDHNYGEWIEEKAAECEHVGWIAHYQCSFCEKNFDKNHQELEQITIAALEHQYSEEWTIDLAPTCEEAGSKSHHCILCDSKKDDTTIDPIGHSYGEWYIAVSPTCLEKGQEERACVNDASHKETREVEAIGHNYSEEWTIAKEPTCTEVGLKEKLCLNDASHKYVETIDPIGHAYTSNWKFNDQGHYHECQNCQDHKDTEEHQYGDWTIQREATQYSEGLEVRHCEICDYGQTKVIPILQSNALSLGAILGIVIGGLFGILIILYIVGYFCLYKKKKIQGKFFDGIYLPMRKIFK